MQFVKDPPQDPARAGRTAGTPQEHPSSPPHPPAWPVTPRCHPFAVGSVNDTTHHYTLQCPKPPKRLPALRVRVTPREPARSPKWLLQGCQPQLQPDNRGWGHPHCHQLPVLSPAALGVTTTTQGGRRLKPPKGCRGSPHMAWGGLFSPAPCHPGAVDVWGQFLAITGLLAIPDHRRHTCVGWVGGGTQPQGRDQRPPWDGTTRPVGCWPPVPVGCRRPHGRRVPGTARTCGSCGRRVSSPRRRPQQPPGISLLHFLLHIVGTDFLGAGGWREKRGGEARGDPGQVTPTHRGNFSPSSRRVRARPRWHRAPTRDPAAAPAGAWMGWGGGCRGSPEGCPEAGWGSQPLCGAAGWVLPWGGRDGLQHPSGAACAHALLQPPPPAGRGAARGVGVPGGKRAGPPPCAQAGVEPLAKVCGKCLEPPTPPERGMGAAVNSCVTAQGMGGD